MSEQQQTQTRERFHVAHARITSRELCGITSPYTASLCGLRGGTRQGSAVPGSPSPSLSYFDSPHTLVCSILLLKSNHHSLKCISHKTFYHLSISVSSESPAIQYKGDNDTKFSLPVPTDSSEPPAYFPLVASGGGCQTLSGRHVTQRL